MDEIILKFLNENYITITLVLGVLKMIAIETPWAVDDKVLEIITGLIKKK